MKKVALTRGKEALIDDEDYPLISSIKWMANEAGHGLWYARGRHPETRKWVYMHRFLLNPGDRMKVDHINHDGLDNRRSNLRVCTHSDNIHNPRSRPMSSTGFIGVTKNHHRFVARIEVEGKRKIIGTFDTAEEAARARDKFARERFGDLCLLNFPNENPYIRRAV